MLSLKNDKRERMGMKKQLLFFCLVMQVSFCNVLAMFSGLFRVSEEPGIMVKVYNLKLWRDGKWVHRVLDYLVKQFISQKVECWLNAAIQSRSLIFNEGVLICSGDSGLEIKQYFLQCYPKESQIKDIQRMLVEKLKESDSSGSSAVHLLISDTEKDNTDVVKAVITYVKQIDLIITEASNAVIVQVKEAKERQAGEPLGFELVDASSTEEAPVSFEEARRTTVVKKDSEFELVGDDQLASEPLDDLLFDIDAGGNTLLHEAARKRNRDLMDFLLVSISKNNKEKFFETKNSEEENAQKLFDQVK